MGMRREQGKDLLLSQLPLEVFCNSCHDRNTAVSSRYHLVIKYILDRPFPTSGDFINAQQWLKAGFAKDCETGECKGAIEDYHFTPNQVTMFEAAMKVIPQEIVIRRGTSGDKDSL
ncbi:hypothetical protein FRB99_007509 [Tulasnella sp. 403]|nr:hypothetical protein FRB99_007509 [Tulasnella sp. 403]